jgi:hypothetical protein
MNKCKNCGSELKLIKHIEYDGASGSSEPYYECPNDCIYPETEDSELTREEMDERDEQNGICACGGTKLPESDFCIDCI